MKSLCSKTKQWRSVLVKLLVLNKCLDGLGLRLKDIPVLFTNYSNFDFRYPAYKVKPAYLRVYNDSMLKYSARVNYDVACPMHFEKYPVDIQRCNVSFESWGHTNHYIMLSWLYEKRKFSKSIALAQFGLDLHFIEEPPSAFGSLGKFFFFCYSHFYSPPFLSYDSTDYIYIFCVNVHTYTV